MGESKSHYDLIVIGAGPGGYVAAIRAAELGMSCACIEKRGALGGTCLNVGCIPSKALLQSSELYTLCKDEGKKQGVEPGELHLNFPQMMRRKDEVVSGLTKGIEGLFKRKKVTSYSGEATFLSPNEIEVKGDAGTTRLSANHFLLATGSEPIPLPFIPFDEKRVLSSTGALSLQEIPKKMVIVGAGVIGVELASLYARLGSHVEIVEMLTQVCPGIDKGIARQFQKILQMQGLTFHLGARVEEATAVEEGITLLVKTDEKPLLLKADKLLVAIGRRPYTAGLNLETAGVALDGSRRVKVDARFTTTNPHIYAIGDLIEGPMLAHKASEEGAIFAESLAGINRAINYMAVPSVIYTSPEVASVGLGEEEAKERGLELTVGSCSMIGNPRARCSGHTTGLVKILAEQHSKRVIGMHLLCQHASEMIGVGVLAIEKQMTLEELADAPSAHPTLSEAIKEAALTALGKAIHL